jgi:LAO/AO transport system kinase
MRAQLRHRARRRHRGRRGSCAICGTLVDRLIESFRKEGKKVGVVAIDPTSPFSGGAILGDRIRMQRHFLDDHVFIRSIATRGALGGLSRSTGDVVRVMDAYGCDVIIVETVGVGQDELEVTRTAHTTLVVVNPGGGDDVQASKAGILEIADVFVVNKADREGADAQARHLESMIALGKEIASGVIKQAAHHGHHGHLSQAETLGVDAVAPGDASVPALEWTPPVLKTIAGRGQGIDELRAAIESHRAFLATASGQTKRARQAEAQLFALFRDVLMDEALGALGPKIDAAAKNVARGGSDPYSAIEGLITDFRRH